MQLDRALPTSDQTTKKPTRKGWLFCLQINDLPEFYVERAMGIENVDLGMICGPEVGSIAIF